MVHDDKTVFKKNKRKKNLIFVVVHNFFFFSGKEENLFFPNFLTKLKSGPQTHWVVWVKKKKLIHYRLGWSLLFMELTLLVILFFTVCCTVQWHSQGKQTFLIFGGCLSPLQALGCLYVQLICWSPEPATFHLRRQSLSSLSASLPIHPSTCFHGNSSYGCPFLKPQ